MQLCAKQGVLVEELHAVLAGRDWWDVTEQQ